MTSLVTINPTTNEEIRRYDEMPSTELSEILEQIEAAHLAWRDVSFTERSERMKAAARTLRDRVNEYAELMVNEMGKPIAGARGEVEKCAWVCDYYADNAERFLADEIVETDASRSYVAYEPIGVVLAIMPWNFPFWQVFRFAAPALMAGNAGALKHSPNVTGCALAIEDVFREAGFPNDLFRTLLVDVSQVPEIIDSPRCAAVTLTGSTRAGRAVASRAGQALKKTVLELGGSDPYIVLDDAALAQAVETCVTSRLINGGQSCIAAKRFIVVDELLEPFTERFVELMKSKTMGDPMDEATDVGPLARMDLRDELHRQVRESVERGAKLLLGGEIPGRAGAFYPPTVLAGVTKGMPAFDEELFGPVGAIIRARDEDHAIRIANDSAYGLGAAIFTGDVAKGERIAKRKLNAGACFVNSFVKSDPRLPFGGIKDSGYGRELAAFGIREFVNVKTVYVK